MERPAYTHRVLAMERTHRLREDQAWLPPSVRRTRWLVSGAVWGAGGAAIVGAAVAAPVTLVLWKGFLAGGAGALVAADRAGRAMLRRQILKMARGEIALADLSGRAEGELVVVRGTIEAAELVRGVLLDAEGVYRRMTFGGWVHEAAVNFTLIDERGERILIEAAGARWMTQRREHVKYPGTRFDQPHVSPKVQALVAGKASVEAFEQVLAPGSKVQIVGYKTSSADVSGDASGYRLPPQRATLRSGDDLPLVIITQADLAT
ncbi:MAG: hypothetical protein JWP01_2174 [Myxococcales bacterium]|nr:hypothetical protein [Myxococcales bacterium]